MRTRGHKNVIHLGQQRAADIHFGLTGDCFRSKRAWPIRRKPKEKLAEEVTVRDAILLGVRFSGIL